MSLFFCNDTATTEIYTLSLHDALPICRRRRPPVHENPLQRSLVLVAAAVREQEARLQCADGGAVRMAGISREHPARQPELGLLEKPPEKRVVGGRRRRRDLLPDGRGRDWESTR